MTFWYDSFPKWMRVVEEKVSKYAKVRRNYFSFISVEFLNIKEGIVMLFNHEYRFCGFILTLLFIFIQSIPVLSQPDKVKVMNGFRITDPLIPLNEIHYGGPPRDGIPSIDKPVFIEPHQAKFLKNDDRVLGVSINGIAKAYPIKIMDWHEIVNDKFKESHVLVTYCPLCGSGISFYADIGGKSLDFGVSGLLYNSDVLTYDRQTESLWSQIMFQAVSGPMKGEKLKPVITENTTWEDWKTRYPSTLVLSTNTGHQRNYNYTAYAQYKNSDELYFPVEKENSKYRRKELVLGIEINGEYKAYPFKELRKNKDSIIKDEFNGLSIKIQYDKNSQTARLIDNNNNSINGSVMYWFAWYAFHPDTEIYGSK